MTKHPLNTCFGVVCLLLAHSSFGATSALAQRSSPGASLNANKTAAPNNSEAGRGHFDRGVDYYRDGNINAALIEFKRAYEAAPNYRVLYNLGQVANALNDYVEAQRYFQRYLQDGGAEIDAERRAEVNAMISKLGGRIASLTVACNVDGAQIFVDDVPVGTTPLNGALRVSAGQRRISAAVSGRPRSTRVIEAVGGERLSVEIEMQAAPPPVTTPSDVATAEPSSSSGQNVALWLGVATGALAVGTGVVGYLAAQDGSKFHDALDRTSTANEINRLHDRAETKAILTDVLLGATAITGAITLYFVFSGGKADKPPSETTGTARLNMGLGSLQLSGNFN